MIATRHIMPAAIKSNKKYKDCSRKQRTHKRTIIGISVLLYYTKEYYNPSLNILISRTRKVIIAYVIRVEIAFPLNL